MLVQFTVKNFMSFKDEAVFDLSAINAYKEHEYNLIDLGIKEKYLKVATIYGANASGKSNLFLAMKTFQNIVIKSLNNVANDEELVIATEYNPFKFTKDKKKTEFQIVFIIGDSEYRYGFEYNDEEIEAEWLYKKSLSSNRNTTIFERYKNEINFGSKKISNDCDIYKNQIPSSALALSFFNKLKLKSDIYNTVYDGITSMLIVSSDVYEIFETTEKFLKPVIDNYKEQLVSFLEAIDTGIKDISYIKNKDKYDFFTHHIGEDNEEYLLDLFDESDGTLKSISIYISVFYATKLNGTLIIDELNAKLHPLLLKFIIDLFNNKDNKLGQLIYTSHDTTLLDKRFFRRDQIWFVEKNEVGHSQLVPLSDYKVRSDASFEKDYLSGVYGGIPFIQDFEIKVGE